VTALWQTVETLVWNIFHRPSLADVFDIVLVAVIIYELLVLTRDTRGSAVLKGLMLLLLVLRVAGMQSLGRPYLAPSSPRRVRNPDLVLRAPIYRQRLLGDLGNPLHMQRTTGRMRRFGKRRKP